MDMSLTASERSIPELDWEMPVEVMRDFDTVLMFGKLAAVGLDEITIRRTSSELRFPILEPESAILIRCYDIRMAPVLLCARVAGSSGLECTVGNLVLIPYKTQRKEVRYPLCPPVATAVLDGGGQERLQPCQLLNISVGGACIVAGRGYGVGQTLQLQVRLAKTDRCVPYPCRVTRVTPRRGGSFEYGLLFEKLDEGQIGCLAEILRDWPHMRFDFPGRSG